MTPPRPKPPARETVRQQRPARAPDTAQPPEDTWLLLVYKVPPEPSSVRVAVWRQLKRLGGLYVQQAACILPWRPETDAGVEKVCRNIQSLGGTYHCFRFGRQSDVEEAALVGSFQDMTAREYAEIVEECETKFVKEIEFERFRNNFTFEEAEEIRQDLEKIRRWYAKITDRDWFGAPGRDDVAAWLDKCEHLLEAFEEEVFERTAGDDGERQRSPVGGSSDRS
jgi:hypothetical protein